MKTTIDIADDLLARAQQFARRKGTTLRALAERGLRIVLSEGDAERAKWKWKPVTFKGEGMSEEFKSATWDQIRDEAYRGRGT